jgi:DME family drug/metabolite transporter
MGRLFAVLAALCNSCIGIFSNQLYDFGMDSINIAFFRCLIALLVISTFMISNKFRSKNFDVNKKQLIQYALLGFLGIFIMYSFEVLAIKYISVSLVSFLLYSSGIITIILGCIFLNEKFELKKVLSIICVFSGVFIIFIYNSKMEGNLIGLVMALIAGIGYSLFIFLMKKFNLESNLKTLFYLFLFGSIYLSIPLLGNINIKVDCLPYLLALAIIPTIGGFYCTNKALSLIDAGKVQLFEMLEPFFASVLAYIVLGQVITIYDSIAGILIMLGLLILEIKLTFTPNKTVRTSRID